MERASLYLQSRVCGSFFVSIFGFGFQFRSNTIVEVNQSLTACFTHWPVSVGSPQSHPAQTEPSNVRSSISRTGHARAIGRSLCRLAGVPHPLRLRHGPRRGNRLLSRRRGPHGRQGHGSQDGRLLRRRIHALDHPPHAARLLAPAAALRRRRRDEPRRGAGGKGKGQAERPSSAGDARLAEPARGVPFTSSTARCRCSAACSASTARSTAKPQRPAAATTPSRSRWTCSRPSSDADALPALGADALPVDVTL